ncbi:MAG TPA: hypothetical protein VFV99_33750 [Kofleriaceae bacterium]|nr:hypothetical protein [Kofleriaceae bacterium]
MLACLLATVAGCGDDDCCTSAYHDAGIDTALGQDANPSLTEVALIPAAATRDLDLLFVLDDSDTMFELQKKLTDTLPDFFQALLHAPGGLPNLHVGVVTTDLGTQGSGDPAPGPAIPAAACAGVGKDGLLQTNGAPVTEGFLSSVLDSGGNRIKNYNGELVPVVQQMASVGATGCAFEQPLEAMRRGLTNPVNAGFLRPNARVAVVVMSDEDDCSLTYASLLRTDATALGPLGSFRCTRFGVACDGGGADPDQMNAVGTKTMCHSNEASPFLTPVGRYTEFLATLKSDPRDVLFSAIVAPTTPFNVDSLLNPTTGMEQTLLMSACRYASSIGSLGAAPAVRTSELAKRVAQGTTINVCDGDLPGQLLALATRVNGLLGTACIQHLINMPAACEAFDIDGAGNATFVPDCATTSARPCFQIEREPLKCPVQQALAVQIMRSSVASPDTWTSVRCAI